MVREVPRSGRAPGKEAARSGLDRQGPTPDGYYTKRSAEDELQAILTDTRRNPCTSTGATFADAAAEYLRYVEQVKGIGRATLSDYRGVVNGYLLPRFGDRTLESITADDIETYRDDLEAKGKALRQVDGEPERAGKLTSRVVVRHLTVLHGIFRRATRVYGLRSNPATAELVERPRVRYSGEFTTLTPPRRTPPTTRTRR